MIRLAGLYYAAFVALAACAAHAPAPEPVPLLTELPDRPHEVLGRVEARGAPGANVRHVYEDLRQKAGALGADAVVELVQRKRYDAAPARSDPQRPELGQAYPGPLEALEPGYFPSYGFDVRTSGTYYVVAGLAIRYNE
jgi:hypothetical protein